MRLEYGQTSTEIFYFYYFLCFVNMLSRTSIAKGFVVLFGNHCFETTIELSDLNRNYCIQYPIALCT